MNYLRNLFSSTVEQVTWDQVQAKITNSLTETHAIEPIQQLQSQEYSKERLSASCYANLQLQLTENQHNTQEVLIEIVKVLILKEIGQQAVLYYIINNNPQKSINEKWEIIHLLNKQTAKYSNYFRNSQFLTHELMQEIVPIDASIVKTEALMKFCHCRKSNIPIEPWLEILIPILTEKLKYQVTVPILNTFVSLFAVYPEPAWLPLIDNDFMDKLVDSLPDERVQLLILKTFGSLVSCNEQVTDIVLNTPGLIGQLDTLLKTTINENVKLTLVWLFSNIAASTAQQSKQLINEANGYDVVQTVLSILEDVTEPDETRYEALFLVWNLLDHMPRSLVAEYNLLAILIQSGLLITVCTKTNLFTSKILFSLIQLEPTYKEKIYALDNNLTNELLSF
jgi:hypothetical protein